MQWWHTAIVQWNGISVFYDDRWIESAEIGFEVDASRVGHGAWSNPDWYSAAWSPRELAAAQRNADISMPFLEALALAYACATFGHRWKGRCIVALSDCAPAVFAINKRYSRDASLCAIIRSIGLLACKFQFDLRVRHIAGVLNTRADSLSRLRIDDFVAQESVTAAHSPTPVSLPPGLTFCG